MVVVRVTSARSPPGSHLFHHPVALGHPITSSSLLSHLLRQHIKNAKYSPSIVNPWKGVGRGRGIRRFSPLMSGLVGSSHSGKHENGAKVPEKGPTLCSKGDGPSTVGNNSCYATLLLCNMMLETPEPCDVCQETVKVSGIFYSLLFFVRCLYSYCRGALGRGPRTPRQLPSLQSNYLVLVPDVTHRMKGRECQARCQQRSTTGPSGTKHSHSPSVPSLSHPHPGISRQHNFPKGALMSL